MDNNMDRYLGQTLDNRYELLEVIGSGGMAVVYKALCHRLNRYVAVKILKDEFANDDEFREHFRAESQAVAMLSHPNIVAVYDFSKSSECQYIVMELLEGITLKQYMQKKGALSWKEALHFATQIAKALSHAHSKGIVHRDIKPQNIMVVKDGSIKVADFGIAHLQNETTMDANETIGSIHYISPEQARGETVDARADIYSLGIVMYEMLTGQLPYEGDTVEAIAVQHFNAILPFPGDINPDIPVRMEEITLRAMTADIDARYQSADGLLDDLEAFRKAQSAFLTEQQNGEETLQTVSSDYDAVNPSFKKGKLSKKEYKQSKARSRRVSTFSGIALLSIFILAIVGFLWSYWIKDMFVSSERIVIPSFIGEDSNEIVGSKAYSGIFNFTVSYTIDPNSPEGQIIGQNPEAGRSIMPSDEGININLTVSTGILMTKIPDLVNHEYREATIALEKLGFVVAEPQMVASDTITEGYVVSTNPTAGEELPAGSTVYISVSGGPELKEIPMPNVVGKTQESAVSELKKLTIDVGTITAVENSDYPKGVIFWQSIEAGEMVTPHTMVYMKVSAGAKETPTPSIEPSPSTAPSAPPPTETADGGGAAGGAA